MVLLVLSSNAPFQPKRHGLSSHSPAAGLEEGAHSLHRSGAEIIETRLQTLESHYGGGNLFAFNSVRIGTEAILLRVDCTTQN